MKIETQETLTVFIVNTIPASLTLHQSATDAVVQRLLRNCPPKPVGRHIPMVFRIFHHALHLCVFPDAVGQWTIEVLGTMTHLCSGACALAFCVDCLWAREWVSCACQWMQFTLFHIHFHRHSRLCTQPFPNLWEKSENLQIKLDRNFLQVSPHSSNLVRLRSSRSFSRRSERGYRWRSAQTCGERKVHVWEIEGSRAWMLCRKGGTSNLFLWL